jgi:Bacteriophage tail tube protein
MSEIPNQVNNFRIYVDGVVYLGIADITLAPIANQTDELRGGAMAGPMDVPIVGHLNDLTVTMTFFAMFNGCSRFLRQDTLNLTARGAVQYLNQSNNKFVIAPWRFMFVSFPKEFNPGRWSQGAKPDMTVSRTVISMQIYEKNRLVFNFDRCNMRYDADGFDYLASTRDALGMG